MYNPIQLIVSNSLLIISSNIQQSLPVRETQTSSDLMYLSLGDKLFHFTKKEFIIFD